MFLYTYETSFDRTCVFSRNNIRKHFYAKALVFLCQSYAAFCNSTQLKLQKTCDTLSFPVKALHLSFSTKTMLHPFLSQSYIYQLKYIYSEKSFLEHVVQVKTNL